MGLNKLKIKNRDSVKKLFAVLAVLCGVLGLLWLFLPFIMLQSWGDGEPGAMTVFISQRAGILMLGLGILFGFAIRSSPLALQKALLIAGFATFAMLMVSSVIGGVSAIVSSVVWYAAGTETVVALTCMFFLVGLRGNPLPAKDRADDTSIKS